MELISILGAGILAVIGVVIYAKSKSFLPPSNRTSPIRTSTPNQNVPRSQTGTEQIGWADINVSSGEDRIKWVDIDTNLPPVVRENEHTRTDDDLDNILMNVIGSSDPCSQEIFRPGQKVYLCRLHRLAYHEDSWREIGKKCADCENDEHTGLYELPIER